MNPTLVSAPPPRLKSMAHLRPNRSTRLPASGWAMNPERLLTPRITPTSASGTSRRSLMKRKRKGQTMLPPLDPISPPATMIQNCRG